MKRILPTIVTTLTMGVLLAILALSIVQQIQLNRFETNLNFVQFDLQSLKPVVVTEEVVVEEATPSPTPKAVKKVVKPVVEATQE